MSRSKQAVTTINVIIEEREEMEKKHCGTCEHWHDFRSFYEYPYAPDDYGHCFSTTSLSGERTHMDDTCSEWKAWGWLGVDAVEEHKND